MHSVMVIDDSMTELAMVQKALENDYRVIPEQGGKAAISYLEKAKVLPSIILLDIDMPVLNGFEVFSQLANDEKTRDIPVIFVTGNHDASTELEAYSLGAVDFIRKPYVAEILQKKISLHIGVIESKKKLQGRNDSLQEFNEQLQDYNDQLLEEGKQQKAQVQRLEYFIIGIITDLITKKDGFSGIHCKRVAKYMEILLRTMSDMKLLRIPPDDLELILMASQLHDMGKIGVPDSILEKVGKYTNEEFAIMRNHTVYAADSIQKFAYLLPNSNFLSYTYQMARSHHEQWCGKGYPDGLAGAAIPQLARILSVGDVYDALVSERTYKKAFTHEQACQIINQGAGIQFDPQVVQAFNRCAQEFYAASLIDIK